PRQSVQRVSQFSLATPSEIPLILPPRRPSHSLLPQQLENSTPTIHAPLSLQVLPSRQRPTRPRSFTRIQRPQHLQSQPREAARLSRARPRTKLSLQDKPSTWRLPIRLR